MRPRLHLHLLLLVLLAGGGAWRGGGAAPPGGALTQPTPPPRAAAPATAAPARPSKASPPLACPAFAPGSPQLLVDADCRWRSGQAPPAAGLAPGESVKIAGSPSLGFIPALLLEQGAAADAAAAAAASAAGGYSLSLKRLTLAGATLPARGSGLPLLYPQGLLATPPTKLSLMDVRLVVSDADFKAHLGVFEKQLRSMRTADDGGIGMHTDGASFLNIPFFSDNVTQLFSVSLVAGPCGVDAFAAAAAAAAAAAPGAGSAAAPYVPLPALLAARPGCNTRTVDNATLVRTLLRDASIATPQPLLVRITSNVTLGPGLNGSLPIRRPVLLLGLASVPTSVDFGMVVNQLNVTAPGAQLAWQSLVLENLAPGDTTSSVIAPPYSTATSTNLWAVYCNRSAALCVPLINVTMVIPTEREVNYHLLIYTMYASPAPSLHQLAEFMKTDLGFKQLEFKAGPGSDTMTIIHLLSKSWHFWNVVTTVRPSVAPKLPLPERPFTLAKTGPAPLVQVMSDCEGLQSAVAATSSGRVYVWRLTANITMGESGALTCPIANGNITSPTHIFGDVAGSGQRSSSLLGAPPPPPLPLLPSDEFSGGGGGGTSSTDAPHGSGAGGDAAGPPRARLFTLDFGFAAGVFQLPGSARDQFFQIQNVTLAGLPQGLAPQERAWAAQLLASSGGRRRRLAAAAHGHAHGHAHGRGPARRLLQIDRQTPPGIWTLLLWPIRKDMSETPVYVVNSRIMLPQPEWSVLAQTGAKRDSFAMQLQAVGGLTFSGVSVSGNVVRVGAFSGPGVSGNNMWLLPDPEAAQVPGYYWPDGFTGPSDSGYYGSSSSSRGASGSSSSSSTAAIVGAACAAAAVALAAAVAAALLLRRRRRRRHQRQQQTKARLLPGEGGHTGGGATGGLGHNGSGSSRPCSPAAAGQHSKSPGGAGGAALLAFKSQPSGNLDTILSRDSHTNGEADAGLERASSGSGGGSGRSSSSGRGSALPQRTGCATDVACATDKPAGSGSGAAQLEASIAQGLQHWSNAVSRTTLQLMQRRLAASCSLYNTTQGSGSSKGSAGSGGGGGGEPGGGWHRKHSSRGLAGRHGLEQHLPPGAAAAAAGAAGAEAAAGSVTSRAGSGQQQDGQTLELHYLLGSGSFASVYLGTWRGKDVAVKVMHLPANALSAPVTVAEQQQQQLQQSAQASAQAQRPQAAGAAAGHRLAQQQALNAPPHMALMEAVVSSTMSHPNVVQVFTYMLTPLMARSGGIAGGRQLGLGSAAAAAADVAAAAAHAAAASGRRRSKGSRADGASGAGAGGDEEPGTMSGWLLQLVMERCEQGTLRDALDKRRLARVAPDSSAPLPQVVLSLSHDICAAMLHLHSEGIVHGDLKAANVLLTAGNANSAAISAHQQLLQLQEQQEQREQREQQQQQQQQQADGASGSHAASCVDGSNGSSSTAGWSSLVAKVGDFGLAVMQAPTDTHATMLARGTPTHMSPELFLAGHVSKASDVYAFGILLYEIMTGRRAYAGVPVPLLPHHVAVAGQRPEWPVDLPPQCAWLVQLAEACWAQVPQQRPTFAEIIQALEVGPEATERIIAAAAAAGAHAAAEAAGFDPTTPSAAGAGAGAGPGAAGVGHNPPLLQQRALSPPAAAAMLVAGGGRKHVSWSEVTIGSQPLQQPLQQLQPQPQPQASQPAAADAPAGCVGGAGGGPPSVVQDVAEGGSRPRDAS